jgi:hypothetical protein
MITPVWHQSHLEGPIGVWSGSYPVVTEFSRLPQTPPGGLVGRRSDSGNLLPNNILIGNRLEPSNMEYNGTRPFMVGVHCVFFWGACWTMPKQITRKTGFPNWNLTGQTQYSWSEWHMKPMPKYARRTLWETEALFTQVKLDISKKNNFHAQTH